jgi:hypothetical protein
METDSFEGHAKKCNKMVRFESFYRNNYKNSGPLQTW